MRKGIIFDLDGTLWDSSNQVVPAWNRALLRHPELDKQITSLDMKGFMGKRLEEIAKLCFPSLDLEQSMKILEECCKEEQVYLREHGGNLYVHMCETLKALARENYHIYLVSNCQEGYLEAFFAFHQTKELFEDYECSGHTKLDKGNNIRLVMERNHLDKACYVGDTEKDEQASMDAGIPFIHAAYGFGKAIHPTAVIQSIEELIDKVGNTLEC